MLSSAASSRQVGVSAPRGVGAAATPGRRQPRHVLRAVAGTGAPLASLQKAGGRVTGPRLAPTLGRTRAVAEAEAAPAAEPLSANAADLEAIRSTDWSATAAHLDARSPLEAMDHALKTFGEDVAIAFSGAEDVALIEYAHLTGRPFRVFSLDTGRLNPETYELFAAVEARYNIRIEYTFPEASEVTELVRAKGLFSFLEDGHGECCRVRKVRPLRRQLRGLRAWITGQRKDQSPGTRAGVPVVEVDPVFEGLEGGAGSLIKYNPLSNLSGKETWNFLRAMAVPTNALHLQGYVSIGCQPCTRPVLPNQHEREGRWWWEDAKAKECGLHSGNVARGADEQAAREAASREGLWVGGPVRELEQEELRAIVDAPASERRVSTLAVLYAPWCPHCQAMEAAYGQLAERLEGSSIQVTKFRSDLDARPFVAERFGMKTFPTVVLMPRAGAQGGFVKYPSERRDVDSMLDWVRAIAGNP